MKADRSTMIPASSDAESSMLRHEWSLLKERLIKSYIYLNATDRPLSLKTFFADLEREMIRAAMEVAQGRQNIAAGLLGLKPSTLCEKLKRLEIQYKKPASISIQKKNLRMEADRFFSTIDNGSKDRDQ